MTCLNNLSVFQLIWVICCWSNVSEVTRSIQGRDGQRYPGFVVQHLCKDFNMFFGIHLRTLNTDWFVQKYYSVSFLNFFKFFFFFWYKTWTISPSNIFRFFCIWKNGPKWTCDLQEHHLKVFISFTKGVIWKLRSFEYHSIRKNIKQKLNPVSDHVSSSLL